MNKFFLKSLIVCLSIGFIFVSCDDDDNNGGEMTINAKVQNGNEYNTAIDNVEALEGVDEAYDSETGWYWSGYAVASAQYVNGGFTMVLTETVSDEYLYLPEFDEGVTISDENAKIGEIYFVANKSGIQVGEFFYSTYDQDDDVTSGCIAIHIYADRDFSITSEDIQTYDDNHIESYTFNINLKKGWNIVCRTYTKDETIEKYVFNNTAPSGMKWYFYPYSNHSYNIAKHSKPDDSKRNPLSPFKNRIY